MPSALAPTTIVVTGAGGPAGVAVIRTLSAQGHTIIAADADPSGVGLRLGAFGAVLPRCDDPRFLGALQDLGRAHGATVVISTVAEELVVIGDAADELAEAGLSSWMPSRAAVERCVDKWAFAQALESTGISVPATGLTPDGIDGPWIVKPRFGRGSRDVFSVEDPADFEYIFRHLPSPIVQHRLEGREFTADALVDRDGSVAGLAARWRLETKAGISTKGETFQNPSVTALVQDTVRALGLTGPACVQGFVDAEGIASLVEVNPRFSGGLPLSLAAGCDLVGQYLGAILGREIDRSALQTRPGVTMLRHFEEVFEG